MGGVKICFHSTGQDFVQLHIPSPRRSATRRRVPISSTGISRRSGKRTGGTPRHITARLRTGTDTGPMGGVQGTAAVAATAIATAAEAGTGTVAEIATGSGKGIAASRERTRGCPERSTMRCPISADTRRGAGSPGMLKGRDGGGLVQARGGIPLEHKAADGRGTCVSLGVYVGMGNSERRDAAADPGRPDPDTGTDSESRLGYRRRRMGTMGYSYSCSRTNSSPKDAWHRRGGSDPDAVACPKSRVRRLGSRLFSSHSESR